MYKAYLLKKNMEAKSLPNVQGRILFRESEVLELKGKKIIQIYSYKKLNLKESIMANETITIPLETYKCLQGTFK
jgi:hypothetical protein